MTATPISGNIVRMPSLSRQTQSVRAAASSLLIALLAGFLPAQGEYTFALDGKPLGLGYSLLSVRGGVVSLQGTPGAPSAGDLLWVQAKVHCLVLLDEAGHHEFFDETKQHGRVRLRRGDREQIAVLDSKRLVEADEATRRGLLGVVVVHWDDAVAAALAALDPTVPLVVTDGTAIGERRALPALPPTIHHLFETVAPDDIAKVLPLLHVVEDRSGFHCMCCGDPTLMFFRAGKEIASIGVHHGASIRWAHGMWNSDALLTREAADGLVQWLADHGDEHPRLERRRSQARAEAEARRTRLRAAVFGARVADDADLDELHEEWLKQAAAAAATDGGFTQLRLLGCHEGAWDRHDEFDQTLLAAAVESLKNDNAWNAVLARCRADERAARGLAAVWVTREREQLARARRAEALPIMAPAALRSPQPWNRARMLQQLRDDPSEAACDVLVAALDGRFAPRQVRDEELIAPGGMVTIHPSDPVLDASEASTQALAALCLAARKHTASLQRIQELAKNAVLRDAEILRQAAEQLQAAK